MPEPAAGPAYGQGGVGWAVAPGVTSRASRHGRHGTRRSPRLLSPATRSMTGTDDTAHGSPVVMSMFAGSAAHPAAARTITRVPAGAVSRNGPNGTAGLGQAWT